MKRIIVADDSATARMFIKRCLQIIGLGDAEIIETEHGKDALAAAKEAPTDLLLTDLNMPVMDGETLVKWVKSSPKLCDTPIVVITSAGNPAKEAQLIELGAHRVINKPVSPPVLMEALEAFLDEE
ncbi:two-component system, chemotaxis family, response regulator CheY [Malonomonas rubra DSM 5091]|uniref:Two-component system, chemotaxis family, response regulator CheY n=1 Tax=Malonomonas rubra DSM 5091 TaxID=1122189 RepID=A0A1M6GA58_MALRU|nr:response regulator [Malonomonas rubra]SHJ06811.1 two-component system, chemotaxis family, response regulator CheY [Malonomonas rubra DSM 5091]